MPGFTYFWGHRPEPDGTVGTGCLSQWWPVRFAEDGQWFASAEHYMMWRKATLFGDDAVAARVLASTDPREVKALGRQVSGFDTAVWAAERYGVVLAGSLAKFGQHDDLRAVLFATGDDVLVEASPHDRVWGIGLAADDPRARDRATWLGRNLLGEALTEARGILRGQS